MKAKPHSYLETAQAFDIVATDYDALYGSPADNTLEVQGSHAPGNAMMAWMRKENLALLRTIFPTGSHLLELGCGTGEEATILAQQGYTILATDISPAMAACTLAKARFLGLSERVRAVALPAGTLYALHPRQLFDGAYASFGGLNCEPDLPAVAGALSRLVRPGGAFVTSVMGRTCMFEMLWYGLHGQPRRALRRLRGAWQAAPVAGRDGTQAMVLTRYFSIRDMTRAFAPYFVVEQTMALPLLLPPPYADTLFRRYHRWFVRLMGVERGLRHRWPWRALGDHHLLVMRRVM